MEINNQNFQEEVLKSAAPVLVDFFAEWCGPCHVIAPVIEELSLEFSGKAKVFKLNVDANQTTASQYGVMSIPTLIFFKGGQEVDRIMGLTSKETLTEKLNSLL